MGAACVPLASWPSGTITSYIKSSGCRPLTEEELQRARMCLTRAFSLLAVCGQGGRGGGGHEVAGLDQVRYRHRRRAIGFQGRPKKYAWARERLWEWFCSLRRSVTTRIPARAILDRAVYLIEQQALLTLKDEAASVGCVCDAAVAAVAITSSAAGPSETQPPAVAGAFAPVSRQNRGAPKSIWYGFCVGGASTG